MNPIDEIVERVEASYELQKAEHPWFFGDQKDVLVRRAVEEYEATTPKDRFDLELLRSRYWGRCNIMTATFALRSVVLRLAERGLDIP